MATDGRCRKRRGFLPWLLLSLGCFAAVGTSVIITRKEPSARREDARRWFLRSGALRSPGAAGAGRAAGAVAPGIYVADGNLRLERGATTVTATTGTLLEVSGTPDPPRIISGSLDVETAETFFVDGLEIDPLGSAVLRLGPGDIDLVTGKTRIAGRELGPGDRFPLRRLREAPFEPEGPAAAVREAHLEPHEPAGPLPAGSIVDAATGAGIQGVHVRAVFFHGTAAPQSGVNDAGAAAAFGAALGVWGAAAVPPLGSEAVETDAGGSFALTAFDPEDPRLCVFIEADHPFYAPASTVLAGRTDLRGGWNEAEVRLRRARTVRVEVLDAGGRPIARAPLRVRARAGGHAFLRAGDASLALDGRVVKPEPPELRFTDDDGSFRLTFSDHAYDFEILHPAHYLYFRSLAVEMSERVSLVLPVEGPLRLIALPRYTERHALVDGDGVPAPDSEIEVILEGMPPQRLVTDAGGWFTVGITPRPFPGEPLSYRHPRPGALTVLTPAFWKRGARVAFPSLAEEVLVEARPAGRLELRTVSDDPFAPAPVAPEGIAVSLDLTLTRRSAAGDVELRGAIPAPGSFVDVFVTGYLPSRVVIPAHDSRPAPSPALDLHLGDVPLSRGWMREVVVTGAGPDELRGATLTVGVPGGPSGAPVYEHRYRVEAGGRVAASGFMKGVYTFGVQGPRLKTFSGAFLVGEANEGEPIEIPVALAGEEDVAVSGRVVDLTPLECARLEVVERCFIAGATEPLTFPPYPLAPDGTFGTCRRIRGVTGIHAAIVSPAEPAAEAVLWRGAGPPIFAAGELRLRPWPRAEIAFQVDGLGRVFPPLGAQLEGDAGIEAIARLRVKNGKLVCDNLRPGNYTLRWLAEDGAEETFGFKVPREHVSKVEGTARRSPHAEEVIEVRVADSGAIPIRDATVSPRAVDPGFEPVEPGIALAKVAPRKVTSFTVSAPGYLSAHVGVEAGGVVPTEIHLYRPAAGSAVLLDADSRAIDGTITVSWEPITPASIRHGEPVRADVRRGKLAVVGLPPIPLLFTLRLDGSDLSIRREWALGEGTGSSPSAPSPPAIANLGTLRFEETRTLSGRVLLPDGSPAEGAILGLVPRAHGYRFPLCDGGVDKALYTAKTGPGGARFVLDGLPLRLAEDLVLVAHGPGHGDAVEDPIDWSLEAHELVLEPESCLSIDVGYRDGDVPQAYGFWLEYLRDPSDSGARIQLGEIDPQLRRGHDYAGIEPGVYRVKWGLREAYEPIPGLWQEAAVSPGRVVPIALRLEGQTLQGEATLNGKPVERGWILLTDDPGRSGGTRVGRIRDGRFVMLDPPASMEAHAAVIPEGMPQALQNIARGEALPSPVKGYRSALRGGFLSFDYAAHDLTIRLRDDFLARHPGAVLSLDYQEWCRTRFEPYAAEELIETPIVRLRLLSPGQHRIAVRSAKGTLIHSRTLYLKADAVMEVR